MNINDISTQLMYTTVPIYVKYKSNNFGSGTGFIFSVPANNNETIPLLITNYHVVENMQEGCIELHISEKNLPTNNTIKVNFSEEIINQNKLGNLDLVAIPIASVLNELQSKNINVFYRTIGKEIIPNQEQINELAAIEDITFVGYPNGLYDNVNKMSIVRRGITATPIWNNFKGEDAFLIDAGVFPGSSGSPVFIYNRGTYPTNNGVVVGNRLMFVGVISSTIKSNNAFSNDYLDLGYVIKSNVMDKEIDKLLITLKEEYNNK
jgi:V8-like Glu-specific endopeptidase